VLATPCSLCTMGQDVSTGDGSGHRILSLLAHPHLGRHLDQEYFFGDQIYGYKSLGLRVGWRKVVKRYQIPIIR